MGGATVLKLRYLLEQKPTVTEAIVDKSVIVRVFDVNIAVPVGVDYGGLFVSNKLDLKGVSL